MVLISAVGLASDIKEGLTAFRADVSDDVNKWRKSVLHCKLKKAWKKDTRKLHFALPPVCAQVHEWVILALQGRKDELKYGWAPRSSLERSLQSSVNQVRS